MLTEMLYDAMNAKTAKDKVKCYRRLALLGMDTTTVNVLIAQLTAEIRDEQEEVNA